MRHAVPAVPLYLIMRGVNSFAFALILTYELAYHTVTLGLTPLQLVTVGVVLESMTLLFELPTGMFADLVSRRLAVILGVLLTDQRVLIWVLFGLYSGMIVGSLTFALGGAPALAVASFCVSQLLRNVSRPLLLLWISQNAERQSRATVISAYWQTNALGQVAGSPVLGWIGSAFSVRAALGLGTLLYVGTLPLLALAARRWRRHGQALR